MSERKVGQVILPIQSFNNHQSFTLSGQQQRSMEESFENLEFITTATSLSPQPIETMTTNTSATIPLQIIKGKRQTTTRNYQLYRGKTIFFCGGRFLTSRAFWAFSLSLFLLFGPCILFLIFTCTWLWYHVSPSVPIIFGYIFLLAFASMLKTSWTDPGIIPKNLEKREMNTVSNDGYGFRYSSMSDQSIPYPKEVTINGTQVRLKYCETCFIYRPPRASHCRQCDNCVENEDHHCIWLNNCIGKRNYTTFFTFIICCTILCCYVIGFSLYHVITIYLQEASQDSFLDALSKVPISFFNALFCFLLLFPITCLTGYHCFLVMRGVTTHEQLRSNLASTPFEPHPYDFGNPFTNMLHVLCRPHNKSYIARRKYVEEIYEIHPQQQQQASSSSNNVIANSNLSTIHDETAQVSNIPLRNR